MWSFNSVFPEYIVSELTKIHFGSHARDTLVVPTIAIIEII